MSAGIKDMTGQTFGRLSVLSFAGVDKRNLAHWNCVCSCGKTCVVGGPELRRGRTTSCGCAHIIKNSGVAAFNKLYRSYGYSARDRGFSFELSKEDFAKLTKQDCAYCGAEPATVIAKPRCNGVYIYNGVDRVDNIVGYTPENCVACCKTCNMAKGTMNAGAFILWAKRVAEYNS